jgi:hypothetical protein
MAEEIAELVQQLMARSLAQELVLFDLIHDAWPLEAHRIERRESVCRALEARIVETDPLSHDYLDLQRVLAEVESLFGREGLSRV